MKLKIWMIVFTLLCTGPAAAQTASDPNEPEITIRHGKSDQVFYDYRVNGEIVEIKVVPKKGKPYYLVPAENGQEYIRMDRSSLLIPKWVLFRW